MAMLRSLLMAAKNRDYDPMSEDGYDSKIPLHNDEAFQHGIQFNAKFIGSMEVPKPTSRVEIVAAMRRIRYEFKAKAVKKRQVNLSISVDGIKVCLWKKKKKSIYLEESEIVVMQHPIYRVFYVSHDSQDLKIFSFIARDSINNSFRCNVFKAYKKNEAMRIVRTIGQAFEVCHKLALQQRQQSSSSTVIPATTKSNSSSSPMKLNAVQEEQDKQANHDILASHMDSTEKTERYLQSVQVASSPTATESKAMDLFPSHSSSEFTLKHQMQFMQEQLQQMQSESELAFNQIKLIKEQLNIEIGARLDSQKKNAELLQRNRELLTHIQQLLLYTSKLEMKLANTDHNFESFKIFPSRPTDLLLLPSLFSTLTASGSSAGTSHQLGLSSDSPDSGKGKEISSDSISDAFLTSIHDQPTNSAWTRQNSTKTFSVTDDVTTQSISIHETDHSKKKHARGHRHGAYSSTSPSLSSSSRSLSRSSSTSIKLVNQTDKSKRKTRESAYFETLSTTTTTDHHLYDHIPPTGLSSFTNSAFTPSPLRTAAAAANEFDPLTK